MSVRVNKRQQRLRRQVLHTWQQYAWPNTQPIYLALSGGVHSLSLLAVLAQLRDTGAIAQPIQAYCLVTAEARPQRAEVWAETFKIPCHWVNADEATGSELSALFKQPEQPGLWLSAESREHVLMQFWHNLTEQGQLAGLPIKSQQGAHLWLRPFCTTRHTDIISFGRDVGLSPQDLASSPLNMAPAWQQLSEPQQENLWRALAHLEPRTLADSRWWLEEEKLKQNDALRSLWLD